MEKKILISELNLMELKELAETYYKISKSSNDEIRIKAEKRLLEILDYMEKAQTGEIITREQYLRGVWDVIPEDSRNKLLKKRKDKQGNS